MNNSQLKKIINSVIEYIKDNKSILERIKREDYEVYKFDVDFDKIIKILKENRDREISNLSSVMILANHYGNPYLTTLICVETLVNQSSITIGIEDLCLGMNKAIVKIFNDVLKENKIEIQITLKNNLNNEEIQKLNFDKIVCLGNTNSYADLRKISGAEVRNVPLFSISLYYDSEKFDDLVETIAQYAEKNFYEIEIFDDEEEFEDIIYMINISKDTYCSVILSDDKDKQNEFKEKIHSEVVCVNENPFKQFRLDIRGKIF